MKRILLALSVMNLAVFARAQQADFNSDAKEAKAEKSEKLAASKEQVFKTADALSAAGDAVLAAGREAGIGVDANNNSTKRDSANKLFSTKGAADKLNDALLHKYAPALNSFNAAVFDYNQKSGHASPTAKPASAAMTDWDGVDQAAGATISGGENGKAVPCPGALSSEEKLNALCGKLSQKHRLIGGMMKTITLSPAAQKAEADAEKKAIADEAAANARMHPVFNKMIGKMSDADLSTLYTGAIGHAPSAAELKDVRDNPGNYYGTGAGKLATWSSEASQVVEGTNRARVLMLNENGKLVPSLITQVGGAGKSFGQIDPAEAAKQITPYLNAGRPAAASAAAAGGAMVATANIGAMVKAAGARPMAVALPQMPPAQASAEQALTKEREKEALQDVNARKKIEDRFHADANKAFMAQVDKVKPCVSPAGAVDQACVDSKKADIQSDFDKRYETARSKYDEQMAKENEKDAKKKADLEKTAQSGAAIAERAVHNRLDLLKPDSKPIADYFSGDLGKAREKYIVDQCAGASLNRGFFGWNVNDSGVASCVNKSISDEMENRVKISAPATVLVKPVASPIAANIAALNGLQSGLIGGATKPDAAAKAASDAATHADDACPSHLYARNPASGIAFTLRPRVCVASCPPGTVAVNSDDLRGTGTRFCSNATP